MRWILCKVVDVSQSLEWEDIGGWDGIYPGSGWLFVKTCSSFGVGGSAVPCTIRKIIQIIQITTECLKLHIFTLNGNTHAQLTWRIH